MIDDDRPNNTNRGFTNAQGDLVEGYTIKQVEDVLHKTGTWGDWERHMFNDYFNNSTKNNLHALFKLYE